MVPSKNEAIQIRDMKDLRYAAVCHIDGLGSSRVHFIKGATAMTKTRCPSGWANAASLLLSPRPKLPTHSAPGALNATTNPSPPRWPHCRGQGMAGAPYGGKPGRTLNGVLNLMSPPNGSRLSCGASAGRRKEVEPQRKRLAGEARQFFPICARPAASS